MRALALRANFSILKSHSEVKEFTLNEQIRKILSNLASALIIRRVLKLTENISPF